MIRVLIVDDSSVAREFLVHILSSDPQLTVAGTASNGEEAVEAVSRRKPDVITMDFHMPGMDGLEATRRIMETQPTPIVIVSGSFEKSEVAATFRAVEAGALAVVTRPAGIGHPDHEKSARELIQTVKLMSEVKVVRRYARGRQSQIETPVAVSARPEVGESSSEIRLIAIGASTGGPVALLTILSLLPKDLPIPVVIVQHMASGFISGFAEWLGQTTRQCVKVAESDEQLCPGTFYLAPDRAQMRVTLGRRILLSPDGTANGGQPSVANLFGSVAEAYGNRAAGVLLTGMGADGAREMALLRSKGAVTFAQDEASSVVHGMPGEAIKLGAVMYVLPPEEIAVRLAALVVKR